MFNMSPHIFCVTGVSSMSLQDLTLSSLFLLSVISFHPAPSVSLLSCLTHDSGAREGEVSMQVGERLSVLDEDMGDGWVRVKKTNGGIGYVPASYIQIN